MVASDTTDFQSGFNGHARAVMKNFVASYEKNPSQYDTKENRTEFSHIVKNLKTVFESFQGKREPTIFENYLELDKVYDFKNKPQFLRYGFSHLMKSKQGKKGYPYFFTLLIENNIYKKEEVIAVVGYLTKSEVLWDATFDANGNYNGYTTKAGFGIGDYWKEYFKGIKNLKKTKLSDKTLYRLNQKDTPYSSLEPDLIEVKMIFSKSNKKEVRNLATASFLDYAILIVDSKASRPVQEME